MAIPQPHRPKPERQLSTFASLVGVISSTSAGKHFASSSSSVPASASASASVSASASASAQNGLVRSKSMKRRESRTESANSSDESLDDDDEEEDDDEDEERILRAVSSDSLQAVEEEDLMWDAQVSCLYCFAIGDSEKGQKNDHDTCFMSSLSYPAAQG